MKTSPRDALQWVPHRREITLPTDQKPQLLVVVDTEEDFDWDAPFDRANTAVDSMAHVGPFQDLCARFGIQPTYVIDYPIVDQLAGRQLLLEYHRAGAAQIGAHLHPWVTPPFEETVDAFHSYPGNLEPSLEEAKLECLSQRIAEEFGERPVIYKAGRYGFGPNTAAILQRLGFQVDLSMCVPFDLSADGGPDYRFVSSRPSFFGEGLLSIPDTGGYVGWLGTGPGRSMHGLANAPSLRWARLPGVLARLRAVDRIKLSPEGYRLSEMKHLTRHLHDRGQRVFSLSLHSPSLAPGNTPYVRSNADLRAFMETLKAYFEFFQSELGGSPTTPLALRSQLLNL